MIVSTGAQGLPKPPIGHNEIVPANPQITINDELPNVLLIGDSISFGYAPFVAEKLKGIANVYRLSGTIGATINGALRLDSANAVSKMDGWLYAQKWAVIHFNWGLHDIKRDKDNTPQVPIEQYEKNLKELLPKLKKSGAHLIWASTTPVPEGKLSPLRQKGDEETYNDATRRLMDENQISINDLHAFIKPHLKTAQHPNNVHFTQEGSKLLGEKVSSEIRAQLKVK